MRGRVTVFANALVVADALAAAVSDAGFVPALALDPIRWALHDDVAARLAAFDDRADLS